MSSTDEPDLKIQFKNGRSTFKEMPVRKISEHEIREICSDHYQAKNEAGSSNYKVVVIAKTESGRERQELIKLKLNDKNK